MGHRYVSRGVIPRHVPDLLGQIPPECSVHLPLEDEIRFSTLRFGSFWAEWALFRAVLARYTSFLEAWKAWWQTRSVKRAGECPPFVHDVGAVDESAVEPDSVSVLIPTLERYDYLRPLLTQLREQTVPPLEIIVVDQTPENRRYHQLQDDYPDLPLKCIYRDQRGQCSSRNAGLQLVRGAYVLFLDDDDEVQPNLIELHLRSVRRHRASVSSGVAHELGAGALPDEFKLFRVSDVLPTNNTLAHVSTFSRSGLFDLAYERGSRADGDLGMRIYRSGALMVLNPTIAVIHHHAPTGGLRTHNTRTITYASSRSRLFHRHLPSATEIYLAMRYFTARQVTEMLWQRALATLQLRGPLAARTLKIAMGLLLLPNTLWRMRRAYRDAMRLRDSFPVIPRFTPWHEARR
jgi:glycosyltransferase involved in cell wall biosynthesis